MHRPVKVAHSSFIEGSHMTKNTASASCAEFTREKVLKHFALGDLILKNMKAVVMFVLALTKKLSK
jgi:hypothetical protein